MNEQKVNISKYVIIILFVVGVILITVGIVGNYTFWKDNFEKEVSMVEDGEISDDMSSENNDVIDSSKKFDGSLSFEPRKSILNTFNISVSTEFTSFFDIVTSLDKELVTDSEQSFSSCKVHFGEVINYNLTAEELSNQMVEFYGVKESLSEKEINGIKWYNFQYGSFENVDVYLTEKNNKLYMFEYTIEKNAKVEVCNQYMPGIINSVSYK